MHHKKIAFIIVATLFAASECASAQTATLDAPPKILVVKDADAENEAAMKAYAEVIEHTDLRLEMLPIPAGKFLMGSPESEPERKDDEGPQREVEIEAFWMGKFEVTWDLYDTWGEGTDKLRREMLSLTASPRDGGADAVTKPTAPYTDMSFKMGKGNRPAISMTQHAARKFCEWLSKKTGRYYRLPTEAEWEYACRAGTTTAYSFGDDPAMLKDYAWYRENSEGEYAKVGQKKPNPWGLYDMHGNVSEWTLDQHLPEFYALHPKGIVKNPLAIPTELYPRVVRGGNFKSSQKKIRSASRTFSKEEWKEQDPQIPQSIWYHTDAQGIGFRVVRPLRVPDEKERAEKWDNTKPEQLDPE